MRGCVYERVCTRGYERILYEEGLRNAGDVDMERTVGTSYPTYNSTGCNICYLMQAASTDRTCCTDVISGKDHTGTAMEESVVHVSVPSIWTPLKYLYTRFLI